MLFHTVALLNFAELHRLVPHFKPEENHHGSISYICKAGPSMTQAHLALTMFPKKCCQSLGRPHHAVFDVWYAAT